ncbi:MAG: sigma-70 family RNA polymerase sigma factor [Flavobacteriales bacterium]|nr:sigma-70 family RNA polymerase sigma factor [Flavobacteriales bacterium]
MFSLSSNSKKNLSDNELIERYRYSYDNAYIGELYQRYSHMLFGVCLKYLKDEEQAKDMVMEVFEKVLNDLKRHQVENFRTWVYSVAKNQCLMLLRKEKRIDARHEEYVHVSAQIMELDLPEHLNGENQEETDRKLMQAVDNLKQDQQQCIKLFYFEKRSYEEIEAQTGFTYKQVKSHLQNGKRNLKIQLSKQNE